MLSLTCASTIAYSSKYYLKKSVKILLTISENSVLLGIILTATILCDDTHNMESFRPPNTVER